MPLNIERIYDNLQNFDFSNLFIKEFRWNPPVYNNLSSIDDHHVRREIAHLADVSLLEIRASNGEVPDSITRTALYKELSALFPKKLLVFIDSESTQSLWYWMKNDNNRAKEEVDTIFRMHSGKAYPYMNKEHAEKLIQFVTIKKLKRCLSFVRFAIKITDEHYVSRLLDIPLTNLLPHKRTD